MNNRPEAIYNRYTGARRLRNALRWLRIALPIIVSGFLPGWGFSQDASELEETVVSLKISQIGVVDIMVYIQDENLFLPITDLFTFLKIQNTPSPGYDSITGFFINQQTEYVIDRALNRIQYQGKTFELQPGDLIRTETSLYLRSDYFGKVFGLRCDFDFRSLSAVLTTNIELPVIREMKLELMRRNLRRLKDEIKADTVIGRSYPLFNFGMADWSFVNTQQLRDKGYIGLNLALGSIILGGEANVRLNYNSNQTFTEKQQYYIWHYADNDHSFLRQVRLGKISSQATSTINSPVVGVQFTNTPTTYRRSFGTYTISDYTKPGWGVELYVNNVLVDYKKADASGFFTFEVPMVYGNSAIMLRFYGPWGEERSRVQNISVPFNFLPPKKLEYTVSAAMVEDKRSSVFSRAIFNYGLNKRMTVGLGAEYLSSVPRRNVLPFLNFSVRLANSLLISGDYAYGVRFRGVLTYNLPWDIHVELNYTRFHNDQTSIITSFRENRKAMISLPIRGKNFASLARLTVDQMIFQQTRNLTSELLFSASAFGVSANLTTYGLFFNPSNPYVYSNLSLGFRLPARIILTPQTQFDYNHARLVSFKLEAEKQFFAHGILKMSYENNLVAKLQNFQIGLRYDFSFAQTGVSTIYSGNNTTFVESAGGSLLFDRKTRWVGAKNMASVGRGGIVIQPFLDMNDNGKREPDEPKLSGLTIHMTGGRIEQNKSDSSVRIYDLEPFISYFIEIDRSSFENVAWQIRKPVINVAVDPNQFKLVQVPVAVLGEAQGMVYVATENGLEGQGRIVIMFYRNDSSLAGRTQTETDGYYSFLGLGPGTYTARIDQGQLRRLNMSSSPESFPVEVTRTKDGDQVGGLDFVLRYNQGDSAHLLTTAVDQRQTPENEIPGINEQVKLDSTSQVTLVVADQPGRIVPGSEKPTETIDKSRKPANTEKKPDIPVAKQEKIVPARTVNPADSVSGQEMAIAQKIKKPPSAEAGIAPAKTATEIGDCGSTIQVGAFYIRKNATTSQARLSGALHRPIVIVHENDFYKVRIPGFNSPGDADRILPELSSHGFPEMFFIKNPCIAIQVGAFHYQENALNVQLILAGSFKNPVVIVQEDGFFKVRITGFTNSGDAVKLLPDVISRGFSDAFIVYKEQYVK
jgi:cell division protein FtsN